MPAVRLFAPEAGLPNEDFLFDCAQHDQDQTDGCQLGEYAKRDAQVARDLRCSQEHGEGFAHADVLAAFVSLCDMAPAAGEEDHSHHETQEQQAEILKSRELRKHKLSMKAKKFIADVTWQMETARKMIQPRERLSIEWRAGKG